MQYQDNYVSMKGVHILAGPCKVPCKASLEEAIIITQSQLTEAYGTDV